MLTFYPWLSRKNLDQALWLINAQCLEGRSRRIRSLWTACVAWGLVSGKKNLSSRLYPTITCMPPVFIEHRLDIMTNVSRPRLKHSLSSVPEIPGPCTLGFKPDHSHKRFPSNPNKTSYCNGKASRLTRHTLTKTVSFLVTTIYFLELCYFESNISMILINVN